MSTTPVTLDFSKAMPLEKEVTLDFTKAEPIEAPKKYLPGREFGVEVAKGLGLDAEKIKAAEDSGGQGEAFKELGSQVFERLSTFAGAVIHDPFKIAGVAEAPADLLEKGIKEKSPGQVVGALAGILGGAGGAGKAVEVAGGAREAIGGAIHTAEGELTPGAKIASKLAGGATGAAAGSLIGHGAEYLGGVGGYKLGPSILDRMFPEPDAAAAARETFQNTKEIAEAQEAALKEAERRANTERITTARATKAMQTARDEALAARDKTAQDLMDRQAAQDKLDAADVRAANAAARAKRAGEANAATLEKAAQKAAQDAQDARDQHAQELMDRQKQQDALDAKHAKALKTLEDARMREITANARFKAQGGTPEETPEAAAPEMSGSSSQDLITRTKKLVKPGELPSAEDLKRAGDLTQVPLPRLQLLASWGDELAKNEINRRLRNQ